MSNRKKKPSAAEREQERRERLQRATCLADPGAQQAAIEPFLAASPGFAELSAAEQEQKRSWIIGYLEAEAPASPLHVEMLLDTIITRNVKLQLLQRAANKNVTKDERLEAMKLLPKFQALGLNQMEALLKHFPDTERRRALQSNTVPDDAYDFSEIVKMAKAQTQAYAKKS